MDMKTCMNLLCCTTSSIGWKTGWSLRSGELAILCDKCGYAFEQHMYCEEFHTDDSGWRQCVTCGKRLHCGCIASLPLIELLDSGGVKCVGCAKYPEPTFSFIGGKSERPGPCTVTQNIAGIANYNGSNGSNQVSTTHHLNTNGVFGLLKQEGFLIPPAATGTTAQPLQSNLDTPMGGWNAGASWVSSLAQTSMGLFQKDRLDISGIDMQTRDNYESPTHPNLNITLGGGTRNLQFASGSVVEEREQSKMSNVFHQGLVSPSFVPPPPPQQLTFSPASDTNMSMMSQMRVARPPTEGRGRHQLLPRYWPRITDQELQQISGDSNCTIVPLFEKMLSASDAGRIGRLVLPKACAEAYFPPISQPEGLPMKIQDVKGKEWVFQFRFWPNNNSRMYVLEGVTPCIQSMQLQAGDTVTFSRMDPGGKLVMGFRKGLNSTPAQATKGNLDTPMNALARQLDTAGGNFPLPSNEKCGEQTEEVMLPTSMPMLERKRSRNIGNKSKRLLIDSQEVQALRLTWEEVQGMLRPPQNAHPTVAVIEEFEFEEYAEPPVFGKSSIFTARSTGVIEQWSQCDNCSKWRRLPADFLLPPKWICAENAWDPTRCFCSAAEDLGPRELECLLNLSKDSKKKRMLMSRRTTQQQESSGLNALANAAFLGDNPNEPGTSSVAATTRHPRHRPGCSCIVCIQPPSGKGKHKSTCTCTVCMTVKRRFKTLMMRKKKRQSDQEAEMALKNHQNQERHKEGDKAEVENNKSQLEHRHEVEEDLPSEAPQNNGGLGQTIVGASAENNASLDLNFHPEREQKMKAMPVESRLTDSLQLANISMEAFMKIDDPSMTTDQQAIMAAHLIQVGNEAAGRSRRYPEIKTLPVEVAMQDLLDLPNLSVESFMKQNGVTSLTSNQQQASMGVHPSQVGSEAAGGSAGQWVGNDQVTQPPSKQVNPSDGSSDPVNTDTQQSEPLCNPTFACPGGNTL